jgi:hypothetical protein
VGSGWTNYFVSSDANSGHEQSLQAFVKVRAAADCVPPGWTVVLKTNGDDVFQYNSPHWTDSTTVLNPTTHPSASSHTLLRHRSRTLWRCLAATIAEKEFLLQSNFCGCLAQKDRRNAARSDPVSTPSVEMATTPVGATVPISQVRIVKKRMEMMPMV